VRPRRKRWRTPSQAVVSWQTSRLSQTTHPPLLGTGAQGPAAQGTSPGRQRPGASHRVINLPTVYSRHGRLAGPPQLVQLGSYLAQAYTPATLALLVLAGLAIAIVGALGPAVWAAAAKTTTALHAE
jgi:hypothetical protein